MDGAALSCDLPYDPHHAGKALPQPGLGRVADGFPAQMDGHSLWAEEPADIPRLTEDVPNRSKRMKRWAMRFRRRRCSRFSNTLRTLKRAAVRWEVKNFERIAGESQSHPDHDP